jgi:DNA-binding protein
MPKKISLVPKAPTGRILLDTGASRVSKDAMDYFSEILEEFAMDISKKAAMIAKHSGRKTVKAKDLRLAQKSS